MATRPYKTSNYLKDPQDKAAYLNEVLESGDFNEFLSALNHIAETSEINPVITIENPNFIRLNAFLHDLGLKLLVKSLNEPNV